MPKRSHIWVVLCGPESPSDHNGSSRKTTAASLPVRSFRGRMNVVCSVKAIRRKTLVSADSHRDVWAVHDPILSFVETMSSGLM